MSLFTEYEFTKCVNRYKGDRHAIKFNCRDQFLVMSFAQFTDRNGLRDIETTLRLCSQDLYRSGLKVMPKSTLAEANEKRDWRIYQDFGYVLIKKAKDLYAGEKLRIDLDEMVCAFDSSTIELCLSLCPWATLHHGKGGFKMHTLMDLNGSIPTFIRLTEASVHDSKILEEVLWSRTLIISWIRAMIGYYTSRKYPDNLRFVVYEDFRDGMDQATPAHQILLRNDYECSLHTDMDSHL